MRSPLFDPYAYLLNEATEQLSEATKRYNTMMTERMSEELEESKADTIRNNAPGYVGPDLAAVADDKDLLAVADLKDEIAKLNNTAKVAADYIDRIRKKYKLKPDPNYTYVYARRKK